MLKNRAHFYSKLCYIIASCDRNRTIDPFEEAGSFSVYGAIELGKDNNLFE